MGGALRLVRAALAMLAASALAGAVAGSASATDAFPCGAAFRASWSRDAVQTCPLTSPLPPNGWVPVYRAPVASRTRTPPRPAGWLHETARQAFVCQRAYPAAPYVHPRGWRNVWWAYTKSDDGVWGWVPEVFFHGGADDERDAGLRSCSAPAPPRLPPRPAPTGPVRYVALGDSYASGESLGDYLSDGTWCHRSRGAYAFRLSLSRPVSVKLRACSGVTTSDVIANQVTWLSSSTQLVTVQIGGNDVNFGGLITRCATTDCRDTINRTSDGLVAKLSPRLRRTYRVVRARAPRARIVVVGYPRLFPSEPGRESFRCRNLVLPRVRASEQEAANRMAYRLNDVVREAAYAAGFRYLDAVDLFAGHDPCAEDRWLNAYIAPRKGDLRKVIGSFHPTAAGHAAYARELAAILR